MNYETIDRIDLRTLHCFERVATLGSFSEASRHLDMPRAAVSRLIAKLEEQVGTRLFQRTTRMVSLTAEGQNLLDDGLPALSQLRDALQQTSATTQELRGTVSFSVSQAFGRRFVLPALPEFVRAHPRVRLQMSVADDLDDLVARQLDFSIRMGELPDSSIVTRKLADIDVRLAVPTAFPAPKTISELHELPKIGYRIPGTKHLYRWQFEQRGTVQAVTPEDAAIITDSIEDAAQMVADGIGIAPLPEYLIADQLKAGTLKIGLTSHRLPSIPLQLCFPGRGKRPARVDAVTDHLIQHIKKSLS